MPDSGISEIDHLPRDRPTFAFLNDFFGRGIKARKGEIESRKRTRRETGNRGTSFCQGKEETWCSPPGGLTIIKLSKPIPLNMRHELIVVKVPCAIVDGVV